MQRMGDEDTCCQILCVLDMAASLPADSSAFVHKRALREYVADSNLTYVVHPDGRQHTLKHGKVLAEAIPAGIELVQFRRKVEHKMRFDFVAHDPDALFNTIARQQRDQAVIDASMLHTFKRQAA